MNFAGIFQAAGSIPGLSHLLRWYSHQYAEGSVVRIRSGLAKGLLWRRHHRYVSGYWIGTYELDIQRALQRELQLGQVFFDIGANAGFFTLVCARLVGGSGRCIAFDPDPDNTTSITEQIKLNQLHYCTVVQEAVADFEGKARFSFKNAGSPMGHLGKSNPGESLMEVTVTTLDRAQERFGNPDFIKMDIEGAEVAALRGAVRMLQFTRPAWLVELHGPECERDVKGVFKEAGYSLFDLAGASLAPGSLLPHHVVARPD